ncbi:hypothetical protein [Clostridium felsineum]|nr:hypothetical protein [Clostridium felsineum]URZ17224.1 hypothetical protein CLFE_032770 [Clostridium felsineum DSM 794]
MKELVIIVINQIVMLWPGAVIETILEVSIRQLNQSMGIEQYNKDVVWLQ